MVKLIETVYNFLWGDLLTAPLPGGGTLPLSLLVILLIPTGVYFTIRTKFLPIRLFKDMVGALFEKKDEEQSALSVIQTLIVSTATRVGMGNLVGVVAAISAGGAGAVFWMWVTALIGSSTAFIEATLSQIYKEKDPLYGGYRGGPAYYIHRYFEEKSGKKKRYVLLSVCFSHSTDLHYSYSCNTCRNYRTSKKCNRKSFGYYRSHHGWILFTDYIVYYHHKYHTAPWCI